MCHDLNECKEYDCTADVSSHYVDITDMILPVMMMNNPEMFVDVNSEGWRSRKRPDIDTMVSMDDMLQGKLKAEEWDTQP